jgi:rod shape-determining protein MreB
MGFFDFLTEEIAIDLGTANTLIIHNDKVVIDSPSIVARDRVSGKIIAVGRSKTGRSIASGFVSFF